MGSQVSDLSRPTVAMQAVRRLCQGCTIRHTWTDTCTRTKTVWTRKNGAVLALKCSVNASASLLMHRHVSSVALPSARPCEGGRKDAQWVRPTLSLPALMTGPIISPYPNPSSSLYNYTRVPICPQCINSSSWNPVLSSIRSQNHQQAWGWFWLSVGPCQPASPSHAWTAITLSQHRNTDREKNTAINIVHWRLSDHLSSSQQDPSHHNWKRIFSLNKRSHWRTMWAKNKK